MDTSSVWTGIWRPRDNFLCSMKLESSASGWIFTWLIMRLSSKNGSSHTSWQMNVFFFYFAHKLLLFMKSEISRKHNGMKLLFSIYILIELAVTRLFTSVNSTMLHQNDIFCELLVTVRTGESLFVSMNSTMVIKWLLWVNFLSQSGQANGFFLVWILRCTFKLQFWVNFLSHSGQTNGFSPVWILRCTFKITTCCELLVTVRTCERLFAGVNSTMLN